MRDIIIIGHGVQAKNIMTTTKNKLAYTRKPGSEEILHDN